MKCKNCSYQFDPSKKGNSRKGNVVCVVLEILIRSRKKRKKFVVYYD
jgi:hypothetical protein